MVTEKKSNIKNVNVVEEVKRLLFSLILSINIQIVCYFLMISPMRSICLTVIGQKKAAFN